MFDPIDDELHAEADRILNFGLRRTLSSYGEVHIVGSYALRLMTWRDLDIHIVRDVLDCEGFFELGGKLAKLLRPHRMHYRDETTVQTSGLPHGLYWGIYFGDERNGAWKIDIWATDAAGFEQTDAFCKRITSKLTIASRRTIMQIKSSCWRHPSYRREFSSSDIYTAVLDHGVTHLEDFWRFLSERPRT